MYDFKLPDLGEGVHEGQVVNVLVNEGDTVAEYQPMLEVETDKAAVEIPAPKSGRVARIHVQAGQVVKVGQVLISIEEAAGAGAPAVAPAPAAQPSAPTAPAAEPPKPAAATGAPTRPATASVAAPATGTAAAPSAAAPAAPHAARKDGPVPAAPAVRKLARELGVNIETVVPTGPEGRVTREDVERTAAGGPAATPAVETGAPAGRAGAAFTPPVAGELPDFAQYGPIRREQPPQIRKTIARQMMRAWQNVPRVTHADKADVTELERNRKAYNAALRAGEAKLTMTAIIIKAVATALRDYPMLNCSFDAAAEEIIYKDFVHVGIAVDTPRGLVVPVLRDADRKSLPQIGAELAKIAEKARDAKFEVADLRGATFSISNVGALGGQFFTPMVNFPETGILGLGQARLEPAVRDGQIVPRLLLPMALSFDHRVVDGADGARFCNDVIGALENPLRLLARG